MTGESRGLAYVEFRNREDAAYVVEGNHGRPPEVVVLDYAVSFEYAQRPPPEDGDWICSQA